MYRCKHELMNVPKASDDDNVLLENKWITVKETSDGYIYINTPEGSAILPFRVRDGGFEVLLRSEASPIRDNFITLISGRVDEGESFEQTAIRELEEEAGITGVDESDLIYMGDLLLGKERASVDKLYIVDVSNAGFVEIKGDGSIYEKASENIWVRTKDIPKLIENEADAYLLCGMGKLINLLPENFKNILDT